MVNILVPTDFSDLSNVAIDFAVRVANKLNGNITLVHIVTMIQPTRASMRLRAEALEDEIMKIAKEDMKALVEETSARLKVPTAIKTRIAKGGSFNDTLKREAKKLRAGLIIMGTRGATGLKKYVLGSNTASIIEISNIPVLVVPELAKFKNFKNLVYATDLAHLDNELKTLIPYAKIFGSVVHVFHAVANQKDVKAAEGKIQAAITKSDYKKFIVKVDINKNIEKGIEAYLKESTGDLLTVFTHEHSFYDRLFNRSHARKLAFQSLIPLLTFRQKL